MNESISRAAGATHGQEVTPENMVENIQAAGLNAVQRNTLYGEVKSFQLTQIIQRIPMMGVA